MFKVKQLIVFKITREEFPISQNPWSLQYPETLDWTSAAATKLTWFTNIAAFIDLVEKVLLKNFILSYLFFVY